MTICTPHPADSTKPARDVAVGRDISCGRRPLSSSSSALAVAFMLANSYDSSSWKSSLPPTMATLHLFVRIDSAAMSSDSMAVAHVPVGDLMGPADASSNMLAHAPMALRNDSCSMSLATGRSR